MTDLQLHDLGIADTEYAALAAKGSEPVLEYSSPDEYLLYPAEKWENYQRRTISGNSSPPKKIALHLLQDFIIH
ncbi:MAG: hypothetical protein AB1589_33150 [Cyanobacteriota bacterium]